MGSLAFLLLGITSAAYAKLTLTGVTVYGATDSRGSFMGSYNYWDTRGQNEGYNVFLFTGSTKSPNFLNTGDTDETLDPEVNLVPGKTTIEFAVDIQDTDPGSPFIGINLYFNEDDVTNRISAVVPNGGFCNFSVVGQTISTYGQYGRTPGAGTLTYTVGDLTVTLTGFCTSAATPNLVTGTDNSPGSDKNIVGSFTLMVTKALKPTSE
ncbi:MAG TPA: hypothetical protein VGY98_13710 [Verrucomicrobiae bacterium]|nr:hypothetical protein [Verrucomicrobiae bacterium]